MTNLPPFRPENYPRIYRKPLEKAFQDYMMAGICGFFGIYCLLKVAFNYDSDFAAGGAPAVVVFGLIFLVIGLSNARAARLTLTADVIEYRDIASIYVVTRRMRREDIRGVYTVDYSAGGGKYGSFSFGTSFVPKDEKADAIFIPEWVFKLDERYDAWVASLPYLGGLYNGPPFSDVRQRRFTAEDFAKVEWRDHRWQPRKG